jgi:hypothetical protein
MEGAGPATRGVGGLVYFTSCSNVGFEARARKTRASTARLSIAIKSPPTESRCGCENFHKVFRRIEKCTTSRVRDF